MANITQEAIDKFGDWARKQEAKGKDWSNQVLNKSVLQEFRSKTGTGRKASLYCPYCSFKQLYEDVDDPSKLTCRYCHLSWSIVSLTPIALQGRQDEDKEIRKAMRDAKKEPK